MNATVVVAIRRRRAAHRASVSSKMPAIAGPAADSPDQNRRFARKTAHACVPDPRGQGHQEAQGPQGDEPSQHEAGLPLRPVPRAHGGRAHPFFASARRWFTMSHRSVTERASP